MSEFAGRISRPRPERAGVCNATRLATRLPNGLSPAAENDYALSLNGVDQYLDCGTGIGNTLGDNYAGSLTVSLWFKANVTDSDDGMFSIGTFAVANGEVDIRINNDELKFGLNGQAWKREVAFTDTASWHHLVCVYAAGSETASKMYLDGVATGATSGSFPASSAMDFAGLKTIIGAWTGTSWTFDGKIDEVGVWSAALSAEAVAAVYNSGRPIDLNYGRGDYANSADLVSWWRMGDINLGGGAIAPDAVNPTVGSELITNGSMEVDCCWNDYNTPTTNERSSTRALSGTYSRKCVTNGSGTGLKSDTLAVVAGTTYEVTCSFYLESGGAAGGLLLRFQNGDGADVDASHHQSPSLAGSWHTVTFYTTVTTTGSNSYFGIYQNGAGVSTFYLDEVSARALGGNPGRLVNEPAYTVDNPPNYSEWALGFDGVDQYGTSAGDATLASKTYSFWAKSTLNAANAVFDHGDERTGAVIFNWSYPHISLGVNYYRAFVDSPKQHDGEWHHWAAYIESDISNCELYVDGVKLGHYATGTSGSVNAYTTGLTIGRASASYYFDGSLDEFAIFDGELTNAQVNEIYRAGRPGTLDGMSPEHWFRMGENNAGEGYTVTDMGSESDDLTLYNTPTFERSVPAADASWNNRSIEFDGVDQYVDLGTSSTLNPANITIAMWVKADSLANWRYLFTRGQADYVEAYRFELGATDLYAAIGNGSTNAEIQEAHGMGTGIWYHVALTYDGAEAALFVDGQNIGTESISIVMEQASRTTTIGQPLTAAGDYFPGQIDSVGLWSRALTAAQILEIYNGGIPFDLSGHLPVAWYRMGDLDNPGGTTIRDFGINLAAPTELVTNGDFATDSDWAKDTGVTISGGKAVWTNTGNNVGITQTVCTIGLAYRVTFTVSDYSSGSVRVRYPFASATKRQANGTYTETGVATSTSLYLQGETVGGNPTFKVDNVSVERVLYGNPGALQNSPTWTTDTP